MQLWMIERNVAGWSDDELAAAGLRAKMCLGWYPDVFWVRSYIDRQRELVTCIYLAESEQALREHAKTAALPCDGVWPVEEVDPNEVAVADAKVVADYALARGLPPLEQVGRSRSWVATR